MDEKIKLFLLFKIAFEIPLYLVGNLEVVAGFIALVNGALV